MLKFHDIYRAGTVDIFLWNKLTFLNGSNFTYMFLMMIPICSASLMKFGKLWKNVENMDISRAGTVGIFLWNKLTSLNGLKFHMHVSDDDSNKFCTFDEIWWLLKKCWNLIIFLGPAVSVFWWNLVTFEKMLKFNHISRAGTVGIFLWKNLTSLKRLKFHMHVSDHDSNMFCKFYEIWWNLKKCWNFTIFLGQALSAFFYEISQPLWMGS